MSLQNKVKILGDILEDLSPLQRTKLFKRLLRKYSEVRLRQCEHCEAIKKEDLIYNRQDGDLPILKDVCGNHDEDGDPECYYRSPYSAEYYELLKMEPWTDSLKKKEILDEIDDEIEWGINCNSGEDGDDPYHKLAWEYNGIDFHSYIKKNHTMVSKKDWTRLRNEYRRRKTEYNNRPKITSSLHNKGLVSEHWRNDDSSYCKYGNQSEMRKIPRCIQKNEAMLCYFIDKI